MTGAMLLPSTDHMIKQFGEECLGSCNHFRLRVVHDDPEKKVSSQPRRILETRIARGSTYAYIQGCPSDRGCSIILRGADRATLKEIKRILTFSVSIAYHLRLEVAYYMDRYATVPSALESPPEDDDGSDVDDLTMDCPYDPAEDAEEPPDNHAVPRAVLSRRERQLLSTSLDIDIGLPYSKELVGTELFLHAKTMRNKASVDSHQTLLVTSLLVGEGTSSGAHHPVQKSTPDVKGIKYYTKQDIALGQFIIENCFQLNRAVNRESTMLDQTLSFIHRPGRVDITVRRSDFATSTLNAGVDEHGHHTGRDPRLLPIYMSSYCKICKKMVTPAKLMSEETWKMSFGKFLEMQYYNRSARCNIGDCTHRVRDDHVLYAQCESYVADFTFIPIHPYALNVRNAMRFPEDLHMRNSVEVLQTLPMKHTMLIEDFRLAMGVLEREIKDLAAHRTEELDLAMADVAAMELELTVCSTRFLEDVIRTFEAVPAVYRTFEPEFIVMLQDKLDHIKATTKAMDMPRLASESNKSEAGGPSLLAHADTVGTGFGFGAEERYTPSVAYEQRPVPSSGGISAEVGLSYPFTHLRDTFLYAVHWNNRMNAIYAYLESVTKNVAQQQLQNPTPVPVAVPLADGSEHAGEDTLEVQRQHSDADTVTPPLTHSMSAPVSLSSSAAHTPAKEWPRDSQAGDNPATAVPVQHLDRAATTTTNLQAQNVKAKAPEKEKPMDKMSRFTKAIQRFLVMGNKEAVVEQHTKFFVPLEEFGHGRYGLRPGRRGEVIPVYEEEYATIIAYSLASEEYWAGLQDALQEGGGGESGMTSPQGSAYAEEQRKQRSVPEPLAPLDDEMDNDQAVADEEFDQPAAPVAAAAPEGRAGLARSLLSGLNKQRSRLDPKALTKPPSHGDLAVVDAPPQMGQQRGKTDEAGVASVMSMDKAFAHAAAEEASSAEFSAFANGSTLFDPNSEGITRAPESRRTPTLAADESVHSKARSEQANARSQTEKQMVSQDKCFIRHRFDDFDDRGNVNCKFQCQTYWAKQFEALRSCYFKGDDRQSYIRSLATSRAWAALGGKSGASFSKSNDERLVIKCISRVELQMFLEFAPAYFGEASARFMMLSRCLTTSSSAASTARCLVLYNHAAPPVFFLQSSCRRRTSTACPPCCARSWACTRCATTTRTPASARSRTWSSWRTSSTRYARTSHAVYYFLRCRV
jgi:hypothetical protein